MIKSTLGALNDKLADIEHNDEQARKGLYDIKVYPELRLRTIPVNVHLEGQICSR